MVLTSLLRTIGTLGFTGKGSGLILCSAQCSNLAAFSLFTRRLEILRLARERELEKDLILVEVESIELPSKAASFSSASRLAFLRRNLANDSASSASARRRASRASASASLRALRALAISSVLSISVRLRSNSIFCARLGFSI